MRTETLRPSVSATVLLLTLVVVIWGVTWPIMKIGIEFIPPVFFGALRMFVGAAFMFIVVRAYGKITLPSYADWPMVVSVGVLQMAIPTALMHFSLSFVEAGRASLLAFTHPIWVAPLAFIFLRERLNWGTIGGLMVGMLGLLVLFNPFGFNWTDQDVLLGNGLLILSALSWAIGIVHVRLHNWNASPLALSPWQMLVSGMLLISLSLLREDPSETVWNQNLILVLTFVGIAATGFAYWGAVMVAKSLPAMVSSLGFLGVPIVGVLSSALLLSEPLTLTLKLGTGLILGGLVIMTLFREKADD
ncbi:DMT family transporter [Rhodophyticola sp.]|uniref:DMT family transporter n=1 Tax=Rhodophyticola sp. TaxID=2680032 RepID=UPI003D27CC1E